MHACCACQDMHLVVWQSTSAAFDHSSGAYATFARPGWLTMRLMCSIRREPTLAALQYINDKQPRTVGALGDWVAGKRHGQGFCKFADGVKFRGEWEDDGWVQVSLPLDRVNTNLFMIINCIGDASRSTI